MREDAPPPVDSTVLALVERHGRIARGHEQPAAEDAAIAVERAIAAIEAYKAQWRVELGIGTHSRMVLAQLWTNGPLAMNQIADHVSLSRGALTDIVDRLEQDGYVQRTRDPLDRRRTIVELTDRILHARHELAKPFMKDLQQHVEKLECEEWECIRGFLEQVEVSARRHATRMREQRGGEA